MCALFWKRSNRQGIFGPAFVVGGVMVFVWKFLIAPMGGALAIYELLPAFLSALIAIVVVSLLTPKPDASVLALFDQSKQSAE